MFSDNSAPHNRDQLFAPLALHRVHYNSIDRIVGAVCGQRVSPIRQGGRHCCYQGVSALFRRLPSNMCACALAPSAASACGLNGRQTRSRLLPGFLLQCPTKPTVKACVQLPRRPYTRHPSLTEAINAAFQHVVALLIRYFLSHHMHLGACALAAHALIHILIDQTTLRFSRHLIRGHGSFVSNFL